MKYIDKVYKINNTNGTVIQPNYKKLIQNMGKEITTKAISLLSFLYNSLIHYQKKQQKN